MYHNERLVVVENGHSVSKRNPSSKDTPRASPWIFAAFSSHYTMSLPDPLDYATIGVRRKAVERNVLGLQVVTVGPLVHQGLADEVFLIHDRIAQIHIMADFEF